jgi:hypothetical protein
MRARTRVTSRAGAAYPTPHARHVIGQLLFNAAAGPRVHYRDLWRIDRPIAI